MLRHAKWISSPALGTLLPSLQQNTRDLLSELAAARCREYRVSDASTKGTATEAAPKTSYPEDKHCGFSDYSHSARETNEVLLLNHGDKEQAKRDRWCCNCCRCCQCGGCGFVKEEGRGCDEEHSQAEAAPVRMTNEAGAGAGAEYDVTDCENGALRSLRKECDTLRIVVQTLRQKDEESQVNR